MNDNETIVHCNLKENAELIAKILDADLDNKVYGIHKITIVEAGNCVCCGTHIDDGDHIFLCKECRRKEEKHLHERLKEEPNNERMC